MKVRQTQRFSRSDYSRGIPSDKKLSVQEIWTTGNCACPYDFLFTHYTASTAMSVNPDIRCSLHIAISSHFDDSKLTPQCIDARNSTSASPLWINCALEKDCPTVCIHMYHVASSFASFEHVMHVSRNHKGYRAVACLSADARSGSP